MMLIVSLLVLFLSVLSAPALIAYHNTTKQATSTYPREDTILTASSYQKPEPSSAVTSEITYLNSLLSNHELYGSWQSASTDSSGVNQQGYATLRYMDDYDPYEESLDMILCLYDGLNTNGNYSCMSFSEYIPFIPANSFNEENMTLSFNQITVHVADGVDNQINELGQECSINTSIYFTDRKTNQPFVPTYDLDTDKNTFTAQFQIEGLDCGINFSTSPMIPEDELVQGQSLDYSIVMGVAALFQCVLCYAFTSLFQQKKILCQRISQGTLEMIASFDLFIALQCFFRLTTSYLIGFTAVPYLVLSLYFERKTIRTIAKAQGDLKQRGFHAISTTNFFVFLVSAITAVLSAFFQKPEWIIILFCFHQIPQIIQNYQTQRRYRWRECLVFLFVLPKLAYIMYLLVFQNLFRSYLDTGLAFICANILIFQLLVLLLQRNYPMLCVKRKALYQSFAFSEKKHNEEACSICLENYEATSAESSDESLIKAKSIGDTKMIMTPCKHHFHECCLRDWTKLKSVCPYCRFSLPPLPEEEDY